MRWFGLCVLLVVMAAAVPVTSAQDTASTNDFACKTMAIDGAVVDGDLATVVEILRANPALACRVDVLSFVPAAGFSCFGPGFWYGCAGIAGGKTIPSPAERAVIAVTTNTDGTLMTPDIVETLCHELTHVWLQEQFGDPGHNERHNQAIAACKQRM